MGQRYCARYSEARTNHVAISNVSKKNPEIEGSSFVKGLAVMLK